MRFTLAVAIVLASFIHAPAAMADATRRPRALTVSSDATLVRTRSRVAYDDLTLVWGRVEGGERVMCASFVGGATSCHSPGLPRRRPARAKMAIGALLASGGFVTLGFGVALLRTPASLGGVPMMVAGAGLGAGGIASIVSGVLDMREHRRGLAWLRARNARVQVGRGLGLALDF